jgi:hypothetical protein
MTNIIVQLKNIKPQEEVVYYTGNLALDCEGASDTSAYPKAMRDTAWFLHENKKACLVQRKVASRHMGGNKFVNDFDYIAIGSKKDD